MKTFLLILVAAMSVALQAQEITQPETEELTIEEILKATEPTLPEATKVSRNGQAIITLPAEDAPEAVKTQPAEQPIIDLSELDIIK